MSAYLPFIDWFKCIGMMLIVIGHVATGPINHFTAPILPKQLGVVLFVFVMGFTLARENGPIRRVLLRRMFEIYGWGVLCALFLSVVLYVSIGTINKSNYLPLAAGINIFFDYFPANPTTWFIGTYFHILLLWALLFRKIKPVFGVLVLSLIIEISVRAVLIAHAGNYIAYMAFPNWITAYIAGAYFAHRDRPPARMKYIWPIPILIVVFPMVWDRMISRFVLNRSFPFAHVGVGNSIADPILTSLLVSFVYLSFAVLLYTFIRAIPICRWARFIAGNTILIFILHMPLYYLMGHYLRQFQIAFIVKSLLYAIVCLPLLAWFSELLNRAVPLKRLGNRLSSALFH
jgi:hypothetical protein